MVFHRRPAKIKHMIHATMLKFSLIFFIKFIQMIEKTTYHVGKLSLRMRRASLKLRKSPREWLNKESGGKRGTGSFILLIYSWGPNTAYINVTCDFTEVGLPLPFSLNHHKKTIKTRNVSNKHTSQWKAGL